MTFCLLNIILYLLQTYQVKKGMLILHIRKPQRYQKISKACGQVTALTFQSVNF